MMSLPARLVVPLSAMVVVVACATGGERAGDAVTRDSAGVSIVEIPSAMDLPTWTIDTNPVVRVGDRPDDPAHELFRVRSAVQLADGRIVVGSQGSYDVRIFDSAGNHLRTFGRQGSGPGEFQWLGNLLVAGDTILAFDWQLQRATTFTTDGEVLGTTHVPFTRGGAVGRVGDGAFVATSFLGGMPRRPQGIHRDTAAIEVVHSSGARDTLGWGVAVEWFSHGDDGVPVVLPFGLRTYVAVANGQVNVAHNDRLEILRYSSGGTLAQVVRIDREPPRVTDADWSWARTTYLADYPEEQKAQFAQRWDGVPRQEHLAMVRGLTAAADGDTWLREFSTDSTRSTWWVIAPDGQPVAQVEVPMGYGLMQVSRSRVVALRLTDEGALVSINRVVARGGDASAR
jgi:hypothetical protein